MTQIQTADGGSATGQDTWDVVVIGGGSAGENAAQYAIADSDRTAVVVEAELVGGECSYWACMPSKALLRPIEVLDTARSVPGVSAMISGSLDVEAILKRRDAFTSHHDDSSQVTWANGVGIDVVRGWGRLTGERTVEVTANDGSTRTLHARQAVVVATGTTATVPGVSGLVEARPWASRDVTNLHEVPDRVAIIGGGVVACEAATWLKGLGASQVTVFVRGGSLLAGHEPFAGEMVAKRFAKLGIEVRLSTEVEHVERPDVADTGFGQIHGGPATLRADGTDLTVDEIVVATGRTPASDAIGLDSVGLDPSDDHGYLRTDDHMAVATKADTPWLYAVGDISGRALLTHMGKYQGRVAGDVIAARAEGRPLDGSRFTIRAEPAAVPAVVFSDPQVAAVGRNEREATKDRVVVDVVEYDLGSVAGAALLRKGFEGRAKLVVDRKENTVVGATFVGPDVAELLHAATIAIVGRVPIDVLWHAVPSYPTVSEVWLRLLEAQRGVA